MRFWCLFVLLIASSLAAVSGCALMQSPRDSVADAAHETRKVDPGPAKATAAPQGAELDPQSGRPAPSFDQTMAGASSQGQDRWGQVPPLIPPGDASSRAATDARLLADPEIRRLTQLVDELHRSGELSSKERDGYLQVFRTAAPGQRELLSDLAFQLNSRLERRRKQAAASPPETVVAQQSNPLRPRTETIPAAEFQPLPETTSGPDESATSGLVPASQATPERLQTLVSKQPSQRQSTAASSETLPAPANVSKASPAPSAAEVFPEAAMESSPSPEQGVVQTGHVAPAATPTPTDWRADIQRAIDALEASAASGQADDNSHGDGSPDDPRSLARVRLLQLAIGQYERATQPLPGVFPDDPRQRRHNAFLNEQLAVLAEYLQPDDEHGPPESVRLTAAAGRLHTAADELAQLGTLTVEQVHLCEEVQDYGVYKPFAASSLRAGQEVMLYGEVANFRSEKRPDGMHQTALKASYRIFDAQGRQVDERTFDTIQDQCRNRRRDFFVSYFIYLPQQIYPGEHTLTLSVEDTLGQKIAQGSKKFTVVGP